MYDPETIDDDVLAPSSTADPAPSREASVALNPPPGLRRPDQRRDRAAS